MQTNALRLFSPVSQPHWARSLSEKLDIGLDELEERVFEDGEHKTRFLQPVTGADCFLLQSLHADAGVSVNDRLIRSLFLAASLHDHAAARVSGVFPYLPYTRKDRRTKPHDPLASRYVAELMEAMHLRELITVDVHNPAAFENAFRIPVMNLEAAGVLARALVDGVDKSTNWTVVSPDAGGYKRAERFREVLATMTGEQPALAFVEKKRSGGVLSGGLVVGEVRRRRVVLVDDMISTGATLARAAELILAQGAESVTAVATHGLFTADARSVLAESAIERIIVSDSIDHAEALPSGIEVVGLAPLLAEVIAERHRRFAAQPRTSR